MTITEALEIYRKTQCIPSECHINWLRENFNPILKSINARHNINWACGSCVKSNMNTLLGWLDAKQMKQETKKTVQRKKIKPSVKKSKR